MKNAAAKSSRKLFRMNMSSLFGLIPCNRTPNQVAKVAQNQEKKERKYNKEC